MKTRVMMIVALGVAAALTAPMAAAQTIKLKLDVPFNFMAGSVMLRSGRCSVQDIGDKVIWLRDQDNRNAITFLTADNVRHDGIPKLVFHRYGDDYFLARVETPEISYTVRPSKQERKLAQRGLRKQIAVLPAAGVAGE